jgi:hypothetical protein
MNADPNQAAAMIEGRRADTVRRQRVLKALNDAVNNGDEISATSLARRAAVARAFLYRHPDLLEQLHAAQTEPINTPGVGPTVSRASLQADLLAAQQGSARTAARIQQLEQRLSELLGEQAWHATGLGAPDDIDQLKQRIVILEQHVLRLQLGEHDENLAAARATNRELMTQLNAR